MKAGRVPVVSTALDTIAEDALRITGIGRKRLGVPLVLVGGPLYGLFRLGVDIVEVNVLGALVSLLWLAIAAFFFTVALGWVMALEEDERPLIAEGRHAMAVITFWFDVILTIDLIVLATGGALLGTSWVMGDTPPRAIGELFYVMFVLGFHVLRCPLEHRRRSRAHTWDAA